MAIVGVYVDAGTVSNAGMKQDKMRGEREEI